jgi:hypothetical protein
MRIFSASAIALILANLVTVYGVIFYQWDFTNILLLYWCESLIIGVMTIIKMIVANPGVNANHFVKLAAIPFFMVHYGGFMAGHFVFLMLLTTFLRTGVNGGPFMELLDDTSLHLIAVTPAIISLCGSHLFSLIANYFGKKEYVTRTVMQLFGSPYKRIFVMHLTLLFGVFIAFTFGKNLGVVILFVCLKTIADLAAHNKEHGFAQLNLRSV